MMLVATAGVVMNGAIAAALWRSGGDVNMRSAMVHMLGDTLSTAAVIAGGAAIAWTGLQWIDPVLSLLIAALIFVSSLSIVRETVNILLEGTPAGISLGAIREALGAIAGIEDVHDLHVWSLGSETHALAAHIRIADIPPSESHGILCQVQAALGEKFHIHHTTIQFETEECGVAGGCAMAAGLAGGGGGAAHTHHHHHHGWGHRH
jgi:cobalt-zinc-cadmium efflux system protein